ncbi:FtsX-like permease family protein [Streptococcus oricebi]|uniref:ABC transporter permease n=1 Tax=Streptococcus oricebi TaxID=1547447 RepID=A0ABS5B253_9STRE|nr:FtsX-like permease family protein [Streptococcus oricebi]MBP2622904.1 ABC transporter permease [Streptococcus oricebi]
MKKSILNKDILLSFRQSKGRFISVMCLMMLGSFALVGLKVASPDIEDTVSKYLEEYQALDLAVISDYGISKDDQKELDKVKGAQVEYGYFTDTVIGDSAEAVRVFSRTDKISQFELVAGKMPSKENELALASFYKGKYRIGDKISLKEENGNEKILKEETFTITGFVNSSEMSSSKTLGSSNAGSGSLSAYAVVSDQAFKSSVYTIARLRFDDVKRLNSFSDSYRKKVEGHQKDLEELVKDNGKNRLADIKSEAKDKISQGQAELEQGEQTLADSQAKLDEGQAQINQKQGELASAQGQIAEKEKVLAQGASQLSQAEQSLAASKSQLDSAASQLAAGQAQLNQTKAQLDAAAAPLAAAKAQLDAQQGQLDAAVATIAQNQAQLSAAKADLEAKIAALQAQGVDPATVPEIAASQNQIASQEAALSNAQAQLEAGQATYNAAYSQYQSKAAPYESGLSQYQAAQASFESKQAQYQAGLAQYQAGQATLANKRAEYQAGQAQLSQAKSQLAAGQEQIQQAQATLNEKKATFETEKSKAEQKFKDGQARIQKAKDEVAGLILPSYHVYTRSTLPGAEEYRMTATRSSGISSVGNIFPLVLYLVAALVTVTTMTRFVNEERINAGVLKALGYNNSDVIKKFVIYGLVAGLAGTLIGILAGLYFLPYILGRALFVTATYPPVHLAFRWEISLVAILCSLICSVLPALHIARKELKEVPAQLLLPKPPSKGSKILLERLPFIWKRLTFTQKVTARNIFRYKQRMLMTIFGVAGSVALLFAGLGITSSLSGIAERQFGEIITYHALLSQKKQMTSQEKTDLKKALDSASLSKKQSIYSENFSKTIKGQKDEQSLTLFAIDSQDFKGFVHLYDSKTKKELKLSSKGAIISQKLANLLHLSVGDSFEVTSDEGKSYKIKVSAISEMYAGHFIFMDKAYYQEAFKQDLVENAYLIKLKDSSTSNIQNVAADFMKLSGVRAVVQNTSLVNQIKGNVKSLGLVMQILTLVSILLAIVILYNLTSINVAERIRELSTIKVLGFHNKEVTLYIYRETISLSLIGIVVGIFTGRSLHQFLLRMIAPSNIMFNPNVSLSVYLVPIISIILILIILGFVVNYTLRRIDMLEALKSVD